MIKFMHDIVHQLWDPNSWYGAIFYGLTLLIVASVAARIVRITAERLMTSARFFDRTVMMFLTQFAQILIYVITLICFFNIIPALNKLGTALLTGVSVMSVIFGLAAQNTLGNLVAGLTLLLYRPFHLDDLMQVATPTGTEVGVLERLTLGYTMLRTLDDRLVVVPNSIMASQVSLNLNRGAVHRMCIVQIGVVGEYANEVRTAMLDAGHKHPDLHRIMGCQSNPLGDGSNILSLRGWCESKAKAAKIKHDIVKEIQTRFAGKHIHLLIPELPAETAAETKVA